MDDERVSPIVETPVLPRIRDKVNDRFYFCYAAVIAMSLRIVLKVFILLPLAKGFPFTITNINSCKTVNQKDEKNCFLKLLLLLGSSVCR